MILCLCNVDFIYICLSMMYVFNLVYVFNFFVLGYDLDDDDEEGV